MNYLKRYLGIAWMLIGPAAIILMVWQAFDKVGLAYKMANALADQAARANALSTAGNTLLQWSIIILVFIPVAVGMVIFGKYAFKGEYDRLPETSEQLTE